MPQVSVADAKARLSEMIDSAIAGQPVTITRRGEPVAQLVAIAQPVTAIDLEWLRAVRAETPYQEISAADLVRRMRDEGY